MDRRWVYIGGGSALLAAGIVASEIRDRPAPAEPAAPTAVVEATAPPAAAPEASAATLERLEVRLAEQSAEAERLMTALAVRDSVMHTLRVSAVQREAALAALRDALAASEARVAGLEAELATLRAPKDFDSAIAALKPDPDASAVRLEPIRAEAEGLDAIFAAKIPRVPLAAPLTVADEGEGPAVEVLFDFASARLSPGAQANAAVAAVTFADMQLAAVRVIGHTDRVGSPAANRRLAGKRARAVAEALVAAGLAAGLIEIDDRGEADPPVSTDDGVPEPLNRTVAIIAVPLPTS
jgi:outer membrane protein OmpA-like peptidoglycan-associated protein